MNQHARIEATEAKPSTRTSTLLREFAASLTSDRVSVAEIVSSLGDRGLGVLIAIFALPNIIPSALPFGNVAIGIPPLLFAIELTLGADHLVLPKFLARRTVGTHWLKVAAPKFAAVLSWFERLLKPRMEWVTVPQAERIVGAICILLALVSTLPIPFGHNLPALGLVLIGLGLIERDGLSILIGGAIGLIGSILLGLVIFGVAHGLSFIIHAHGVHI